MVVGPVAEQAGDGDEPADEPAADSEPVDASSEGRPVRVPTLPYVPTEQERREHNVTHYPHRTWCECCMAGRAIAGAHAKSKDEIDPRAGELHFDYCFLKMVLRTIRR